MSGLYRDYVNMFKDIMNWDESNPESKYYQHGTHKVLGNERGHYLWNAGYAMGDMGFHGWDGDAAKNERDTYKKIETAYFYLLKALAEAIDFEWTDESVWKWHLQDIDTDDILKMGDGSNSK